MRTPLTVYKASAGSGKTFTLAIEYIKLLINNPTSYRNTLAVTFTNKATEEMKMRILSQLYGIWKMLPDSDNYTEKITNELNVSREFASERAGQALSFLIHDYSNFKVETIDAFFQSVLRNLAKELELTANLKIGLNDKQVEEQAVDRLIENLHATSKVLLWIISYIQKNVDEEKSWNVIHDIKRFGLNIFKDIYKSHRQELNDSSLNEILFKELNEELAQIQKQAIDNINQYVETFFDTLSEYGLQVEDFSNGKSGVCGYFLKLRNGVYQEEELLKTRVVSAMEDSSKWAKKADWKPGKPIYEAVNNTL
ncbi:MAG: UvrD-helicase domain-containing protein, partial [Prevotella sp.]|nr:UvrD-helicase domain-containing protein [Prevotella sp.]